MSKNPFEEVFELPKPQKPRTNREVFWAYYEKPLKTTKRTQAKEGWDSTPGDALSDFYKRMKKDNETHDKLDFAYGKELRSYAAPSNKVEKVNKKYYEVDVDPKTGERVLKDAKKAAQVRKDADDKRRLEEVRNGTSKLSKAERDAIEDAKPSDGDRGFGEFLDAVKHPSWKSVKDALTNDKEEQQQNEMEKAVKRSNNEFDFQDVYDNSVTRPVGRAVKKGGIWAIEQAERPVMAVNSARKYIYEQDEESDKNLRRGGSVQDLIFGSGGERALSGGAATIDAVDDLNVGDIGGALGAFWKGLTREDGHKITNSDIIRFNAERNPEENVYDNKYYQGIVGFAGDVAFDPLSYVGVGLARSAVQGVKGGIKGTKALDKAADVRKTLTGDLEDAQIPKSLFHKDAAHDESLTSSDLHELLGGNLPKRFANRKEQRAAYNEVRSNLKTLSGYARKGLGKDNNYRAKALQEMEAEATRLKARRQQVMDEGTTDVFEAEVVKDLPETAIPVFNEAIQIRDIRKAHVDQRKWASVQRKVDAEYGRYVEKTPNAKTRDEFIADSPHLQAQIAETKNFHESMGPHWQADPRFDDAGRQAVQEGFWKVRSPEAMSKRKALTTRIDSIEQGMKAGTIPKSNGEGLVARLRDQRDEIDAQGSLAQMNNIAIQTPTARLAKLRETDPELATDLQQRMQDAVNAPDPDLEHMDRLGRELNEALGITDNTPHKVEYESVAPVGRFTTLEKRPGAAAKTLDHFITIDKGRVFAHVNKKWSDGTSLTPAEQTWLREVAKHIEQVGGNKGQQEAANAIKAQNVGTKLKVHTRSDIETPDEFQKPIMDAIHDEMAEVTTDYGNGGRAFFVATKGKPPVVIDTLDSPKAIRDAGLVTKADETASSTLNKVLHEMANGVKKGHDPKVLDELIQVLRDGGESIPTNRKFAIAYIRDRAGKSTSNHGKPSWKTGDVIELSPESIAFNRTFKTQRGESLAYYRNRRALLNQKAVVVANGKAKSSWYKNNPLGITQTDFVEGITKSPVSAVKVLRNSPFRLEIDKIGTRTNFIEKRAGKQPAPPFDQKKYDAWNAKKSKAELEYADEVHKWAMENPEDFIAIAAKSFEKTFRSVGSRQNARIAGEATEGLSKQDASRTAAARAKQQNEVSNHRALENVDGPQIITKAMQAERKRVADNIGEARRFAGPQEFRLEPPKSWKAEAQATAKRVEDSYKAKINGLKAERKEALDRAPDEPSMGAVRDEAIREIDLELERLRGEYAEVKTALTKSLEVAEKTSKAFNSRLQEELLLKAVLDAPILQERKALSLNLLGSEVLTIPGTSQMIKAAEAASGLPGLKAVRTIYQELFKPASTLPRDLLIARNRALNNTANIIQIHTDELMNGIGKATRKQRELAATGVRNGFNPDGAGDLTKQMHSEFEDLLKYFDGSTKIGRETLSLNHINRYLPKKYALTKEDRKALQIETPGQLLRYFQGKDPKADPLEILWTARIAAEQAVAYRALVHTINDSYGVFQGPKVLNTDKKYKISDFDKDNYSTVAKLKNLGWKSIERRNNFTSQTDTFTFPPTHLFPPEIVPDIHRLLDMMEPRNVTLIGKKFDDIIGIWKAGATVYNPGYYTRNLVGELMTGWFGGVTNPKYYAKATRLQKYLMGSNEELLQILKSHAPWADYKASSSSKGSAHAVRVGDKNLNLEQVAVLYHDQGLKTGFINTEFRHQDRNRLGDLPVGKQALDVHSSLRSAGEHAEDWPRMAHFMHALENAPTGSSVEKAAEYASAQVRKYHFDYSDITNFEKAVMMRAFPFYKWSRKALPLMTEMMFLQPGKVMAYPKLMTAYQDMQSVEPLGMEHENGFRPNFGDLVPEYLKDMGAYGIGWDAEGKQTFGNVATPQLDAAKMSNDPLNSAWNMTNPLLKQFVEQTTGAKWGGGVFNPDEEGGIKDSFGTENYKGEIVGKKEDRISALMDILPGTNFIDKIRDSKAATKRAQQKAKEMADREGIPYDMVWEREKQTLDPIGSEPGGWWGDERVVSFLTGMGLYENYDVIRQNKEAGTPTVID